MTDTEIQILYEGQRILCKQCGCHGFNIIAKGYHCRMCSPVLGTKVKIKTMNNKSGQVIKKTGMDIYSVRLKDGTIAHDVGILELNIV